MTRAGIVGAGAIGRVHLDALRRIGVDVVALAASDAARAQARAAELRVPRACADAAELVALEEVDVVHVCTPNALHAEQVRQAMAAGKHVVCEKPLATTAADATALWREAEASGLVHATAYNYRFFPMVRAMRARVAAGELGRVHLVRGAYLLEELLTADPGSWLLDPRRRGDALSLADVGVHWWDLVEHVTGQRVERVVCTRQAVRAPGAVGEDSAAAILRLDGGATAVAAISGAAPGHANTIQLELIGDEAALAWEQEDPDRLWIGRVAESAQCAVRSNRPSGVLPPTLQLPAGHVQGYLDAFRDLMAAVYARIEGGGDPREHPTFEDGAHGLRVLEALVRSAETQAWVTVAS